MFESRLDVLKEEGIQEADIDFMKEIQSDIFRDFRGWVEENRKDKLNQEKLEQIFSADVVLGPEAKELGLIDDFGEVRTKFKEIYGKEVEILNFSKSSPLELLKERF